MTTETIRRDLHADVTNAIIAALEAGTRPWVRPWTIRADVTRPLRSNGVTYRGINILTLWLSAAARGFGSPYWMTFKQAHEMAAHVKKGERSTLVVYASTFQKTEATDSGEITERNIPFLKGYPVFNAEQIEGLPAHYYPQAAPEADDAGKDGRAEQFIAHTGAVIRHEGNQPLYSPSRDVILCPAISAFDCPPSYYETITHELIHFTGHESRLGRIGLQRHGVSTVAFEELIAELGAAFLCADLGLTPRPRDDHAAYVASWLEALKNDKRMIFAAATKAQQAADFLHGLQPGTAKPAEVCLDQASTA